MTEFSVKKAIIFAAGFGSRMVPVTLDRPKPLVRVNGVRIIDTLLDALFEAGIEDITITRGYKKECFDELLEKYPMLKFIDNPLYDHTNSISSAMKALELIEGGCYLCEADLMIANPGIIRKWHTGSDYLGTFVRQTDDWCLSERDGYACDYRKGGTDCFNCYGISCWSPEDCERLRADIAEVWESGEQNVFWEFVPLVLRKDGYKVKIHECSKGDVVEIDTFQELVAIDPSYKNYPKQ